jgi:ABC-type antimicrobial peptide transport system permease subunit
VKPLSFWIYIVRNFSRVLPVVIIFSLSVVAILTTKLMVQSIETDYQRFTNFYKSYATVTINQTEDNLSPQKIIDELNAFDNIDHYLIGSNKRITITALTGDNPYNAPFISKSKSDVFLREMNWKLLEGRLPQEGRPEIVLTSGAMKNKRLKIGDKVGDSINQYEFLKGEYTVVGVLDGGSVNGALGFIEDEEVRNSSLVTFFLKAKSGQEQSLDNEIAILKNRYKAQITVQSYSSVLAGVKNQLKALNLIIWWLNILIAIIMTISIILLILIFMNQRMREFAILDAFGYHRSFLIKKVIKEFSGLAIFSWFTGLALSQAFAFIVNSLIFEPMDISSMTVLDPSVFFFSLPFLSIVILATMLIVFYKISKMEAISVIEKRS